MVAHCMMWMIILRFIILLTAWKVFRYGIFSGPYFPLFALNTGKYRPEKTPHLATTRCILKSDVFTFLFKGAATGMRYFARIKFSTSLVHRKNFSLIWQVVFELGYVFWEVPLLSLNELGEKSQATIILGKFVNKP